MTQEDPLWALECPCGQLITGREQAELVTNARVHLQAEHPQLGESYSAEQILSRAYTID
jgi:hypothetical protein